MWARQGHSDREDSALALAATARLYCALVHLHEALHDREPKTETAVTSGGGGVGLPEAVEDVGQELRRDPLTAVAHGDFHLAVDPSEHDSDAALAWRELDRVREQVPYDLLQAAGVTVDQSNGLERGLQVDFLDVSAGPDGSDGGLENRGGVDQLQIDPQLARDDPAHVQQVLDHLSLGFGVSLDHLQPLRDGGRATVAAEDTGPAHDRVQRSPQLMAQGSHELVLQARGALGFGARRAFARQQRFAVLLGPTALADLPLELAATLVEAAADHHRGTDKDQAQDDRSDQNPLAGGSGHVLLLAPRLEEAALRRVEIRREASEGGHDPRTGALRHVLQGRPVAAFGGVDGLLQLIQLGVGQPGEAGYGRRRRRLIGAQAPQLAHGESDLCDRGVVLSQVGGVAREQEPPLIGFGVRENAVEVVQGLQHVVRSLHAGAGVRQRR